MKQKRPLTEFGIQVKTQLLKRGKTQKEFAQDLGISATYLAVILHGKRSGQKYIGEIAKRLKIDLDALDKREYDKSSADKWPALDLRIW